MLQRVCTISLLVWLAALPAAAQTPDPTSMSLEDLMATPVEQVYGASRFLQKVSETPASITIVSADDIRAYGYRTLADILRSVEGVSITYDRNYTYLGMRGLSRPGDYNTRVLVLIDGHRMNNNVEDMAMIGSDFQLDVAAIQRVEVIRGPAAALYGSGAFSAVVDVIMKRGHEVAGFDTTVSLGSFDTREATVTWGRRLRPGLELLATGSVLRSEGARRLFFPAFADEDSGGVAERSDAESADKLALAATFRALTVHALYARRAKDVPTASFDTLFNSRQERTSDRRGLVDAQYTREVGLSTDVLVRAYWDSYSYDGDYPYEGETPDSSVLINRDRSIGRWWGAEAALSTRLLDSHHVTAGVEYRNNVRQSTQNFDVDPHAVYIDNHPESYSLAVSAQDEYLLSRRLLVNLAGRGERLTTGDVGFSPKVGVIVTPRAGTGIKLLFSRALRAPSVYELYYQSPSNVGNAGLTPERIQSLEVNVEHYLTSTMSVESSLYANTYEDLIVGATNADDAVWLENGLNARARGLELAWQARGRLARTRASYSTLFDADAASAAWTSGAPSHLLKLHAATTAIRRWTTAIELQYESSRLTHLGERLAPAAIVNANIVRASILPGIDLNIAAVNLFDHAYSEPVSENHRQGAIEQDGRQLFVGLTWRSR